MTLTDTLRGAVPDWVLDEENDVALFKCIDHLSSGQQIAARLWLALRGHWHLSPTALELLRLDAPSREAAFGALRDGPTRAPEATCSLEVAHD